MQQVQNTVLYEEVEVYSASNNGRAVASLLGQKRRAQDLIDQGGLLVSPDGLAVAVLDSTATCVTLFHSRNEDTVNTPENEGPSCDLAVVRSFQPTHITGSCLSAVDAITAYCWSADGSRLGLACSSGYVYTLDRSGQPAALLPPFAGPWAGKPLGALAMPLPSTVLLLTARPAQLFVVPLDAPSRVLQVLRPQKLARYHETVRVAAYEPRTSTLVVAGEGCAGGGGAKRKGLPIVSVSAWRLDLSGAGPAAAAAAKAVFLGSFAGPVSDSGDGTNGGAAAWPRRRWTLSLSPLGEHVALVAPPAPGVVMLSLPQCRRVEPAEQFNGLKAPPASAFRATLARSVESALSASLWNTERALAVSDIGGYVGLAQLPGYDNLLAGDEQPKYAPGTLVASKVTGAGSRGLLVLEPLTSETKPGPAPPSASDGYIRGGRVPRGAASQDSAAPGVPGVRLLLLAQRTPKQMLQVHMRNQQWGRALELCAAAGLDADRVYIARWASRPVDAANIADNLAKIVDRHWVVEECCRRVSVEYEGQRKLINYGLRETARQAKPPASVDSVDDASSNASAPATPGAGHTAASAGGLEDGPDPRDAAWWWCKRLQLWRHSDRLEVLYAAQGRSFNPAAYTTFRDLPLDAAAGSWAATGAIGPLAVLVQQYAASLSGPVLLGVLSRLPETINPRLYSALLPRVAEGEGSLAALRPPPARKPDWVEQREILAEIQRVLATGSGSASGSATEAAPVLDPEATDAVVQVLAPRSRLSAGSISEWYAERALQLDAETGQLQGALTLLELGWDRGARGPRVAKLLGAARALTGIVGSMGGINSSTSARGSGLAQGDLWRLRLGTFAAMPGGQQLRLLLSGTGEETLAEDLRDRVVPFLHGPGWDSSSVGPLVANLLAEEMAARPGWAAALVEAEARGKMLFANIGELVQAVTTAVVACPHTDEWPSLERAVVAVQAAVEEAAGRPGTVLSAGEEPATAGTVAGPEGGWLAGLRELRGFVRAGSLLAARGLPLTVRHVSSCGREEAARCLRQVLGKVQRSSPCMSDAMWSDLWRDLAEVRALAFPFLAPEELLSELARCMLHCGRNDLANAYLHGAAPGASPVALESAVADALIVSVATEILAGANDPWDSAAQQSAACLALASPNAPSAVALGRLLSALQLLPDMGLDILPAQVMQMKDRFEVIRLILEGPVDGASTHSSGFATAGVTFGVGISGTFGLAASAALGGKFSRRRAAVRAAGKAAAAGGRAAVALAGGLLAVAGRVAGADVAEAVAGRMAPVAGMVAGAVAATVSAATAAAPSTVAGSAGGIAQPPYKQVGRLLELADLLGLDAPEDELRLKDLAGRAALRAGDLDTAQHLALGLLAARYVPAWSLCADLGSARHFQDDSARQQLLSYALLHCPAERMTRLLEDLRAAEKRCLGEAGLDDSDRLTEAPEYLLRVALLAPGQRVTAASPGAPPTACLPSPGDTHLALAVLGPGAPGSIATAVELLGGIQGISRGGGGADGSSRLPYAQLQRIVAMECFFHCLRALLPAAKTGAERLQLLERPLGQLLQQVRKLDPASSAIAEAVAAALATEARLAAARDSRTVRQHVPDVDAVKFASGGEEYRRQAILQQAALAGATEAEAPGASPRAAGLLEQARQLAGVYGVDPWDIELHFTSALVTANVNVTPELRAAVQCHEPALLKRPAALLRHLAATAYPLLPVASGPHLALWLAVLTDCLHACAKDDPTAAALAASTAPLLAKLRDLLEKAGAALKGLALTQVHAPLLAPLLAPLGATLAVPSSSSLSSSSSSSSSALGVADASITAAGAIFSYVKPSNLAQAIKLVTALHKLLGPQVKKTLPSGALLFPDLQRSLDALPLSLPYLCLCVKAIGTKITAGNGGAHQQHQHQHHAQQSQRDMAVAWGHVSEHVVRLPPEQLAAWLAFLLLPGSPCPLEAGVSGAPLAPCPCPVDVRLTILDACMPMLLSVPSASAQASAASAGSDTAGNATAADPGLLRRLHSLHRRLLMLRAARQHSADGLDEQQLRDLEMSLASPDDASTSPGNASDAGSQAVSRALATLAAAGCPATVLLDIAAVAVDTPADVGASGNGPGDSAASPAMAMVEAAVSDALSSAFTTLQAEATMGAACMARLKGILKCLDRQPHTDSKPQTSASASASSSTAEMLRALRDLVWRELQRFTDEQLPNLEQQGTNTVSELLDMQADLGTRAMWEDWALSGGSSDEAGQHRLRLLTTRTRAMLAHLPPPSSQAMPTQEHKPVVVHPEDLATCGAAEKLFSKLLQAARTTSSGGSAGEGTVAASSLPQLRLLARLLTEVWRDGDLWGKESASSSTMTGYGSSVETDVADEQVGIPEGFTLSPLHRCWRELAEELLRSQLLVEAVSLLDPPVPAVKPGGAINEGSLEIGEAAPQSDGRLLPLSPHDVQHLIQAAAAGPAGVAASWCLGLASPYKEQNEFTVSQLQTAAITAALRPADALDVPIHAAPLSTSVDSSDPIQPDTAVLLLALLLQSGNAVRLAASAPWFLVRLILMAPATPAEAAAGASVPPPSRDVKVAGLVLPCLAAFLAESGHCGLAAALISRRLKLHPALAGAGGSMLILERYLKSQALPEGPEGETQAEAGLAGAGAGSDSAGDALLGCWPAAVEQLRLSHQERCRRALRAIATVAVTDQS